MHLLDIILIDLSIDYKRFITKDLLQKIYLLITKDLSKDLSINYKRFIKFRI